MSFCPKPLFALASLALVLGCSDSGSTGAGGGAGGVAAGGSTASGGSGGSGNSVATGGTTNTGGANTGGATNTGGTSTGGTTGTGGSIGTVTTACPGAAPASVTTTWCSCAQYGQRSSGGYIYYNNIWGSGAGAQCIWTATGTTWGIAANHPNSSGIKSYPNISLSPRTVISSIGATTSTFDVTVPTSGAYETAYDIWVRGTTTRRIEIMLWMNYTGAVQPIAAAYDRTGKAVADKSNVTVGGHTWNVYFGTNGSNDVVSFVRNGNVSTGTVDVRAILSWIIANNTTQYAVFTSSWTLDQVQFGFEITSDGGSTQPFVTNDYSVTSG